MLQNLEDTASELIHYQARTVIEENQKRNTPAHNAFNPRLGKEAKKVVFPGQTAQDLVINPATGGYDLTNCRSFINGKREIINLNMDAENTEKKSDNTNTNISIQQNTSNSSLKTDTGKLKTVTTPGNKKKEKGKKGKGKKRRKNDNNNKTDEPPKKKPKTSDENSLDILFSEPGPDERAQNLTNISNFHQDSPSNSQSGKNRVPGVRIGSKTRRREQDFGEDHQEYTGHVNVLDDQAFQSQQQLLSGFQPPQNQLGLTNNRDPRKRKQGQDFGTGLADDIDYNDYEHRLISSK